MKEPKIKFVNLHSHDTFSNFDGLGYPNEHYDFAYSNGMNAMAITNHGNMNSLPYQVEHVKKMRSQGKSFKAIFGCEAYYHPDIEQWHLDKEKLQSKKDKAKKEEVSGTLIENEEETKKGGFNPLNHRRHLILIAQNQTGLNNLYKLVSKSYTPYYFYRFPRIDLKLLAEHSEGLIVGSACCGGLFAGDMWMHEKDGPEKVYAAMKETAKQFMNIFGDRFYGELQWNGIEKQHELNQYIIKLSKELGFELISTADSHYPTPESWQSRILYKYLGHMGFKGEARKLPESVEELGYELYPKNGDEMWESYKKYSEMFQQKYDDELIRESIERTYQISEEKIEDFYPENSIKLPNFVIPEGKTADEALRDFAEEGLRKVFRFKNKKYGGYQIRITKEYFDRLERELKVIEKLKFSQYFLTMKEIADASKNMQLVGVARGSAGGSLVAYALGITQMDPIQYDLQFERFLTSNADGMQGYLDENGNEDVLTEMVKITLEDGRQLTLTPEVSLSVLRNDKKVYINVSDLKEGDDIL